MSFKEKTVAPVTPSRGRLPSIIPDKFQKRIARLLTQPSVPNESRRGFLSKTSLALAGLLITPGTTLSSLADTLDNPGGKQEKTLTVKEQEALEEFFNTNECVHLLPDPTNIQHKDRTLSLEVKISRIVHNAEFGSSPQGITLRSNTEELPRKLKAAAVYLAPEELQPGSWDKTLRFGMQNIGRVCRKQYAPHLDTTYDVQQISPVSTTLRQALQELQDQGRLVTQEALGNPTVQEEMKKLKQEHDLDVIHLVLPHTFKGAGGATSMYVPMGGENSGLPDIIVQKFPFAA